MKMIKTLRLTSGNYNCRYISGIGEVMLKPLRKRFKMDIIQEE